MPITTIECATKKTNVSSDQKEQDEDFLQRVDAMKLDPVQIVACLQATYSANTQE